MKVTYIFDDSFFDQFLTVTNSILRNEKKELADSIEFYISFFGKEESVEPLLKLSSTYFPNNKFYIKHVPTEFADLCAKYEESYHLKNSQDHIPSSVLARFDLDKIWPEITDRVLYLDLDLIVRGRISELFDLADKDSIISACNSNEILASELHSWKPHYSDEEHKKYYDYLSSFRDDLERIYNRQVVHSPHNGHNVDSYEYILGKEYDLISPAFNAGVFILNIAKYKKDSLLRRDIDFLISLNRFGMFLRFNDQSILNFVFHDKVDWIDPRWNRLHYGWDKPKYTKKSKENFPYAKIIHYNGQYKPWLFNDDCTGLIKSAKKKLFEAENIEYFKPGVALWKEYELCEK
tara:strand:+ start:2823 stop:3869 length:1047 start_codon:yes stop_codon:yes gene_type:complete